MLHLSLYEASGEKLSEEVLRECCGESDSPYGGKGERIPRGEPGSLWGWSSSRCHKECRGLWRNIKATLDKCHDGIRWRQGGVFDRHRIHGRCGVIRYGTSTGWAINTGCETSCKRIEARTRIRQLQSQARVCPFYEVHQSGMSSQSSVKFVMMGKGQFTS